MSGLTSKEKRQSRIIALQLIYASELNGSGLDDTYQSMIHMISQPSQNIINYAKNLSILIKNHLSEADKIIKDKSKNWDFKRIAIIDKLILRIALIEMIYVDEVPLKVSISEGVEIAKQFSTEDSSSFINGILDSVYNDMIIKREQII